ncbi:D-inositol-3-phosphate glycosyltransferase [Hoyosella rhizosphaerae]|uniref:D-inositol-3-phosphate glycosyltransferase n=1 Tax=Hoyosella rhizosphaerae TaxID=1755582 RepID=UPI001E329672
MTGLNAPDIRRVAVISVHTSPLAQPGTGDAGGMNVYVLETAKELARRGILVDIFTRATSSLDPHSVEAAPGVTVRNIVAGPFEGLGKTDLPSQMCPFTAAVLREEASHEPGHYDLIHSHYWLSGQVGWLARDRWGIPLVHTAHTLAAVKNASLAHGDVPEPLARQVGEQQIVNESDRLLVNTDEESQQLQHFYHADPRKIDIAAPGADLAQFTPGDKLQARKTLGIDPAEKVIAFVGRIQPLKAPDVLLRAVGAMLDADDTVPVRVLIVGGTSGTGQHGYSLDAIAHEVGIEDRVTFLPPQPAKDLVTVYRAADVVAVPSYSESFGLVALEAQACGTPVVAAHVGGLGVAVADAVSGQLVDGHDVHDWASALREIVGNDELRARYAHAAPIHAAQFSWGHTVDALVECYRRALGAAVPPSSQLTPRRVAGRARVLRRKRNYSRAHTLGG